MKFLNNKSLFAILTFAFFLMAGSVMAQADKSKRASPPAKANGKVGTTQVVIDYSQPSAKGREIYGGLVPYGKLWRTGANEATTFAVDKDVTIEGKPLAAGKYALFTIPGEKEWTVIFNKNTEQGGTGSYDESLDALRVQVKPKKAKEKMEKMTFDIKNNGKVSLVWADTAVEFLVKEAAKNKKK